MKKNWKKTPKVDLPNGSKTSNLGLQKEEDVEMDTIDFKNTKIRKVCSDRRESFYEASANQSSNEYSSSLVFFLDVQTKYVIDYIWYFQKKNEMIQVNLMLELFI